MYYDGSKLITKKGDISLHAERNAILKCRDRTTIKNMIVIRIKKSGLITGGICCNNCCNFINSVRKKINLKTVYQLYSKDPHGSL